MGTIDKYLAMTSNLSLTAIVAVVRGKAVSTIFICYKKSVHVWEIVCSMIDMALFVFVLKKLTKTFRHVLPPTYWMC